jgi:hypothetical protein
MASTRHSTAARITEYAVQKTVSEAVRRRVAISELEAAAERWETKAHDGAYTVAKDVRDYWLSKAKSARREAAKLRGENVPEPEPRAARTVSVTLPR